MAFAIFKVIDTSGGKITAQMINNTQGVDLATGNVYKFTFVKSSDLEINTDDGSKAIGIEFNYKDNF